MSSPSGPPSVGLSLLITFITVTCLNVIKSICVVKITHSGGILYRGNYWQKTVQTGNTQCNKELRGVLPGKPRGKNG